MDPSQSVSPGLPNASAPTASPTGSSNQTHELRFRGNGGSLFGMMIVNAILASLTLGIYYFWGKAKIRQYIFSQTEFAGDTFTFHGTGKEMFLGFLKLIGLILGFVVAVGLVSFVVRSVAGQEAGLIASIIFMYLGMFLVMPYAIVGSRQYRMSRTSYRGIKFSFRGTAIEFLPLFVKGALLSGVTLGFYSPYFVNSVQSFLMNQTYYGNRRFSYDGKGDELFWMYLKGFFLTMVTAGIYSFWFQADQLRYLAAHSSFGEARFESKATGGAIFGLGITNMLLVIFTLGLAMPWVVCRTLAFWCDNLVLRGPLDIEAVRQESMKVDATGEALADALDIGAGL
jgi:uncharacterized membrane protein YjgN (DUF898 family)